MDLPDTSISSGDRGRLTHSPYPPMRPERRSEPFTHAQQNEMSLVHHVAIKESPWNEQAGVPASPGTTTQQEAPTVSLQQAGFPLHLAPTDAI